MKMKDELKGCWLIISVLVGILLMAIIFTVVMGSIGDLFFDFIRQKK